MRRCRSRSGEGSSGTGDKMQKPAVSKWRQPFWFVVFASFLLSFMLLFYLYHSSSLIKHNGVTFFSQEPGYGFAHSVVDYGTIIGDHLNDEHDRHDIDDGDASPEKESPESDEKPDEDVETDESEKDEDAGEATEEVEKPETDDSDEQESAGDKDSGGVSEEEDSNGDDGSVDHDHDDSVSVTEEPKKQKVYENATVDHDSIKVIKEAEKVKIDDERTFNGTAMDPEVVEKKIVHNGMKKAEKSIDERKNMNVPSDRIQDTNQILNATVYTVEEQSIVADLGKNSISIGGNAEKLNKTDFGVNGEEVNKIDYVEKLPNKTMDSTSKEGSVGEARNRGNAEEVNRIYSGEMLPNKTMNSESKKDYVGEAMNRGNPEEVKKIDYGEKLPNKTMNSESKKGSLGGASNRGNAEEVNKIDFGEKLPNNSSSVGEARNRGNADEVNKIDSREKLPDKTMNLESRKGLGREARSRGNAEEAQKIDGAKGVADKEEARNRTNAEQAQETDGTKRVTDKEEASNRGYAEEAQKMNGTKRVTDKEEARSRGYAEAQKMNGTRRVTDKEEARSRGYVEEAQKINDAKRVADKETRESWSSLKQKDTPKVSDNLNTSETDPCRGRYIYIHELPSRFNEDMTQNCKSLNKWLDMCLYITNFGLGPELDNTLPEFSGGAWFSTNQFALELIFHHRMKQYKCLTKDSSKASAIFVPYYSGLDVSRYLWYDKSLKDSAALDLVTWLRDQEEWKKMWGRDHFFVAGRITWDFRREGDNLTNWGNKLMYLPESKNMTILTIESSPWHRNDFAVPYPSYFHPKTNDEIQQWQHKVRKMKRKFLFSFAGGSRPNLRNDIRGEIFKQCEAAKHKCSLLQCVEGDDTCYQPANLMNLFESSVFCLQPSGDSFTRRSTFDSILAGCIPVFFHPGSAYVQYLWHFPREFEKYSVYIPARDVKEKGVSIERVLSDIPMEKVVEMREQLIRLIPRVTYAYPRFEVESYKDAFDVAVDGVLERVGRVRKEMEEGKNGSFGFEEEQSWKWFRDGKVEKHEWDELFDRSGEMKFIGKK